MIALSSQRFEPARRALLWLLLAVVAAWLAGAVLFLADDGAITFELPRSSDPPRDEHNVALHRFGPTVRASSYFRDPYAHHHPAFLVDARAEPSTVEKWMSSPSDRKPWVEIRFREPRVLSRIVIHHAGAYESPALTARTYRIRCLLDREWRDAMAVARNEERVAHHLVSCANATGVRLEFVRTHTEPPARVYEVEVWGR